MSINLKKGQKIDLRKASGESLTSFCVGVNWGAFETEKTGLFGFGTRKVVEDCDLDLSCVMTDSQGEMVDSLYSPEYNGWLRSKNFPLGKLKSMDNALHHSGDDRQGDVGGDDGLDNEVITVDLNKVNPRIEKIFFFLNIYLNDGQSYDFSDIPFAKIRMYEGTPSVVQSVHASYDVVTDSTYKGKKAIILGKLYKRNGDWKFDAIGDATDDPIFMSTLLKILKDYTK